MHQTPTIRKETAEDIPSIRAVVHAAFGSAGEADLVEGLRRSGALTLSAVAVVASRVIGHVAFSPVTIGGPHLALALAPVAVAPDCQRQGIGSALIRWSLEECQRLGHGVVIVVGEPAYYPRFGFTPASPFGIQCPFPVPPEAFMVLELSPGAASGCRGMVRYRPEFESV
jgi:putative acetyltransferase